MPRNIGAATSGSGADRVMPSFLSRLRRVLGCRPRIWAAPRGPSMTHWVWRRTVRIWRRSTASREESRQVRGRRRGAGGELGVALEVEGGAGREDDGALQDVLQLADVPGPSIGDEASHGLPAHSVDPLADASGELVDQEPHEQRDVLGAVAERRERDREDAEAVVEVFAEGLVVDGLEQVAVGGGDDPDVDRQRRAAADALDLALLEDAEELGLGLQGEIADLVEEEGPAVGQLEAADPPGEGAGEGAFLVAEQLALDQARGQGGAVELDQRLGRAAGCGSGSPGRSAPCRSPSRR